MTHEEADSLLASYVADNLPGDVMRVMEGHLDDCPACREIYARQLVLHLTRSVTLVATAPLPLPYCAPNSTRTHTARSTSEPGPGAAPMREPWRRRGVWMAAGFAAAGAALLLARSLVPGTPTEVSELVPAGDGAPTTIAVTSEGAPRIQLLAAQGERLTPAVGGRIPPGADLVIFSAEATAVFVVDGAMALELKRGQEGWRYSGAIPSAGLWVVAVRDPSNLRVNELLNDAPDRTRKQVTRSTE